MLILKKWHGGLGNNIGQLRNIIHIALYHNINIELPKHQFFDIEIIKKRFDNNENDLLLEDPEDFFYKSLIKNISEEAFNINFLYLVA